MIIENRETSLSAPTSELVRAQAKELRGVDIGEARAEQIASDIGRIEGAASAARELLDFNDEPTRFTVLLSAARAAPARRR